MTYLNLDTRYFDHPKTRRLIGILGRNSDVYPLKLWAYAAEYHEETGDLSSYTDSDLEEICGWRGVKGKLIEVLVEVGFIDRVGDKTQLHNWQEHEGHIAALKERNRANAKSRWAKYRKAQKEVRDAVPPQCPKVPKECQNDAPNQPTKPSSSSNEEDMLLVIDHYNEKTRRDFDLNDDRREMLTDRLKKYTVEQLKEAIDGITSRPYNMGQNQENREYLSFELIFKSDSKVDEYRSDVVKKKRKSTKVEEYKPLFPTGDEVIASEKARIEAMRKLKEKGLMRQ